MKLTSCIAPPQSRSWRSIAPRYADAPRSVFCIASRTTPRLDQNNYVAGATGRVYVTWKLTTNIPTRP